MKKKEIIISILIVLILATIIVFFNKKDTEYYKEITYTELNKKRENKDDFILYIHQTGCRACNNFSPTLKSVINANKVTVYALNLTNLSEEESQKFDISIIGTPTIIFFKDGEEESETTRLVGVKTSKVLTNKLKNMGYIK